MIPALPLPRPPAQALYNETEALIVLDKLIQYRKVLQYSVNPNHLLVRNRPRMRRCGVEGGGWGGVGWLRLYVVTKAVHLCTAGAMPLQAVQ